MSQSSPSDNPSFTRELPGMLIFFVVVIGTLHLAHHYREPVMERFALHGGNPGEQPPWYFITRDFAEGICSLGALILSVVVAAITWRWWPSYSSMMVWMPLLWHGGHVAQSWIIYQSCPGLLYGQRSTTPWQTLDSYLHDAGIERAETLIQWSAVILAAALPLADRFVRRRLNRNTP